MNASSIESLERGHLQVPKVYGLEANVADAQGWLSNISESWNLSSEHVPIATFTATRGTQR